MALAHAQRYLSIACANASVAAIKGRQVAAFKVVWLLLVFFFRMGTGVVYRFCTSFVVKRGKVVGGIDGVKLNRWRYPPLSYIYRYTCVSECDY